MTIKDLKINQLVHLYLAAFGVLLFAIAFGEAVLLTDQPGLCLWAFAAAVASLWFMYRMDRHAKALQTRITYCERMADLHASLDSNFEKVIERTGERFKRERRRVA